MANEQAAYQMNGVDPETYFDLLTSSVHDPAQVQARETAASRLAQGLGEIGRIAFVSGHILGTDRRDGRSPFGYGDDAVVAVARLASISSQLLSGAADLISSGRVYAGAALLRQVVEVEYLARLFANDLDEAAKWLRSDKRTRMQFFSPRKLREASDGFFRDGDYGWHCELGGHPVPNSGMLLENRNNVGQLMLSDAIGHAERIADYAVKFLAGRDLLTGDLKKVGRAVAGAVKEWRFHDELTRLPPPATLPK